MQSRGAQSCHRQCPLCGPGDTERCPRLLRGSQAGLSIPEGTCCANAPVLPFPAAQEGLRAHGPHRTWPHGRKPQAEMSPHTPARTVAPHQTQESPTPTASLNPRPSAHARAFTPSIGTPIQACHCAYRLHIYIAHTELMRIHADPQCTHAHFNMLSCTQTFYTCLIYT